MKFSTKLIRWHKTDGRKDLPWQQKKNPYKVWVSEIMLQQTQVSTVIPFYISFLKRFPNVKALAKSSEEDVMSFWSGLGYYSRARNLHKTSKLLVDKFNGKLPGSASALISLPGIGKSTAGAILSLGYDKRAPILDANVKRVLSRHEQIEGDLSRSSNIKKLWSISERLTPLDQCAIYNQAIMDLGALICKRSNPKCKKCPVKKDCLSFKKNLTKDIPKKVDKKSKPSKNVYWLIAIDKDENILLKKRNKEGVWAGLWSFPESSSEEKLRNEYQTLFKRKQKKLKSLPEINHSFSHFNLRAKPLLLNAENCMQHNSNSRKYKWIKKTRLKSLGVPSPVKRFLEK